MKKSLVSARAGHAVLPIAIAVLGCTTRTFGVGTVDGGAPAGEDAAVHPSDAGDRAHTIVASDLCAPLAVAVSEDGATIGFLSCADGSPSVVTYELASGERHELGVAREGSDVALSPDGALVVWEDDARQTVVRSAIGARAAAALTSLPVLAIDMIRDDRSLWTLILLADQGGGRSAVSLASEPFDSPPVVVLEGHDVGALLVDEARRRVYARDGATLVRIALDPAATEGTAVRGERPELLASGLTGDHGLVRDGDALWAVSFDDPADRVALGSGWSGAAGSIVESREFVYFVSSGELGRASIAWPPVPTRIRPAPLTAIGLTIEADLLALAPTELQRVDPTTGAATLLATLVPVDPPSFVVSTTWAAVATLDGVALVSTAGASRATVIGGAIRAETLGLDGLGSSACWIEAGVASGLTCASGASQPADRIAARARGWWAIPGTAAVLAAVETDGGALELRRFELGGS